MALNLVSWRPESRKDKGIDIELDFIPKGRKFSDAW